MLKALRLKLTRETPLRATAWFFHGDEAALWLRETEAWLTESQCLKFYLIPAPERIEVAGVLVVPPSGIEPPEANRGQPYGEVVPGFFIPSDAGFSPPVTAAELTALKLHAVCVFHPTFGLSGHGETDFKRASDFLQLKVVVSENWSAARTTPPLNQRLRSVRLQLPSAPEGLFGEESRDIGSAPLSDLPPTEGEPRDTLLSKIVRKASSAFARALAGLTSYVPRTVGITPTWINRLENWAKQKLANSGPDAELAARRRKELQRLLDMLDKDPEQALRHAVSLAGPTGRGQAQPTSKLGSRDPDFQMHRANGGASDAWPVTADIKNALANRYREAAHRELKLGRHRRAAYIYAELLGDFMLAADVLKQGKFFREAAVLYKDHLGKPLLAAECLAAGGLLEEAVEIYEKHERWLEVADLYERIPNREKARAAIRRAVDELLDKGDVIGASRLIETRLQSPDEALSLLALRWPNGSQAITCMEEQIALLSRLHRANALRELVIRLGTDSIPQRYVTDLIVLLGKTAENALSPEVQRAAAEAVRVRASCALSGPLIPRSDEQAILRAVTRLVPYDRLLVRDVTRYCERRPAPSVTRFLPPRRTSVRRLSLSNTKSLNLPKVGTWVRAVGNALGFGAVARADGQRIFFTRGSWDAALQSAYWPDPAPDMGHAFFLKSCASLFILGRPFKVGLKATTLPGAAGIFNHVSCSVGTPEWLPDDTVQVTFAQSTYWAVRVVHSRVILVGFNHEGSLIYSQDVTEVLLAAGSEGARHALSLEGLGAPGNVVLGFGNCLLVTNGKSDGNDFRDRRVGNIEICSLEQQIVDILPGHLAIPGWIVILEVGAAFVSRAKMEVTMLDDTIKSPRATYLSDGRLLLMGEQEAKLFQRHDGQWLPSGWFPAPPEAAAALGLCATNKPHEFALFQSSGAIQRWNVSE